MAQLPIDTRTKTEKLIEDTPVVQGFRPYLGISSLGNPCERALWYGFRCCAEREVSPRLNRLFQRGHREELIIQEDLRKIGVIHHSDQKEVVFGWGHGKGHIDDILENVPDAPKTPHLGEYKTHNHKSFTDLKAKGMKTSKPVHYAQMIVYMRLLGLKRGLYVAVNKDNDERYYERISENIAKADELLDTGKRIIRAEGPPPQKWKSTWYACKWCDYYNICHFDDPVRKGCRTCQFGDIHPEGVWKCSKYNIELAFEQQLLGCHRYQLMGELRG